MVSSSSKSSTTGTAVLNLASRRSSKRRKLPSKPKPKKINKVLFRNIIFPIISFWFIWPLLKSKIQFIFFVTWHFFLVLCAGGKWSYFDIIRGKSDKGELREKKKRGGGGLIGRNQRRLVSVTICLQPWWPPLFLAQDEGRQLWQTHWPC